MADELTPGQVLNDTYRLVEIIGKGGMGEVWRAQHERLPKEVAVKVLSANVLGEETSLARFRREAEIATRLDHPGIVGVIDWNTLPSGVPYMVMELLAGESLRDRIRRGRLPLDEVTRIVRQVGAALAEAHRQGVVHRDLKPENIFLVPEPGEDEPVVRAKVLDFGISKIQGGGTALTQEAEVLGTPVYMAPEQAAGRLGTVSGATDQYALGAIAYEALSGAMAFTGHTLIEVLARILEDDPTPLEERAQGLPEHVYEAVRRALCKRPSERFAGITAFVEAFSGGRAASTMQAALLATGPGAAAQAAPGALVSTSGSPGAQASTSGSAGARASTSGSPGARASTSGSAGAQASTSGSAGARPATRDADAGEDSAFARTMASAPSLPALSESGKLPASPSPVSVPGVSVSAPGVSASVPGVSASAPGVSVSVPGVSASAPGAPAPAPAPAPVPSPSDHLAASASQIYSHPTTSAGEALEGLGASGRSRRSLGLLLGGLGMLVITALVVTLLVTGGRFTRDTSGSRGSGLTTGAVAREDAAPDPRGTPRTGETDASVQKATPDASLSQGDRLDGSVAIPRPPVRPGAEVSPGRLPPERPRHPGDPGRVAPTERQPPPEGGGRSPQAAERLRQARAALGRGDWAAAVREASASLIHQRTVAAYFIMTLAHCGQKDIRLARAMWQHLSGSLRRRAVAWCKQKGLELVEK